MINYEKEDVSREHWQQSNCCAVCDWNFPIQIAGHSPFIHHCRFCGCTVCNTCSGRGLMSRKYHGVEERACDVCWTRHQDNILDLDRRLARIESDDRLKKKIQTSGSILNDSELVKVFALDGSSVTLPIDEKTTASSLSRAALRLLISDTSIFECGLWESAAKLEKLERLEDDEYVSNILSRWRLKSVHKSMKLVVPIQPVKSYQEDSIDLVLEQIASLRKEEANQRRNHEFLLKGKSSIVRITDILEVDGESRRYALGHDGRLAFVYGQVSVADMLTFDDDMVVADASTSTAIVAGVSLESFIIAGSGKRLEFTAENVEIARRWRKELLQVQRVQNTTKFELIEDIIAAIATQKSRFQAADIQLDAAEKALKRCTQDFDSGLLRASTIPAAADLFSLASSLFECDPDCVDDGTGPLREDARCAAFALLDACADTAGRAKRFANTAYALLARNHLQGTIQQFVHDEPTNVHNTDDDSCDTAVVEKNDNASTTNTSDGSAWLLASAQKGLCTTMNNSDDEFEEVPFPVHYAVKDLEITVSSEMKRDSFLDWLRPVRRLGSFNATTVSIALNSLQDDHRYYEVKTTLKHEAARLQMSKRLIEERRALSLVSGSSSLCVQLVSAFTDANFLYLVLDFPHGGTLAGLLPISPNTARFYLASLAMALSHCHDSGVVHRDVRTQNAKLDIHGYCVLSNFHCAAVLSDIPNQRLSTICGVLAPECMNGSYDYAVDWWALGRLALELVARSPFGDEQNYSVIIDAANGKLPKSTTACLKATGSEYAGIVTSLLAARPKRLSSLFEIQKHPAFSSVEECTDEWWIGIKNRTVHPPECYQTGCVSDKFMDINYPLGISSPLVGDVDAHKPLSSFYDGNVVCFTGDNQLFNGFCC